MRRHLTMILSLSAVVWCALIGVDIQAAQWPEKPNVILILADDFGWTDTGFMGSRFYETPHLDQMAQEGMRFTNAYSNAPNCAPTRACLMTGLYTPRHGIFTVGSSERGEPHQMKLIPIRNETELDTKFVTMAEVFREAGYRTASIGKWHLGQGAEGGPQAHGFELNIGGDNEGRARSHFAPFENPNLPEGPEGEYLTDRLTSEAVGYIESHQKEPFFLYLPYYAVHAPIEAKQGKIDKYRKKSPVGGHTDPVYAAMIESLDEGVGKILETLNRLNLRKKTLVLFFSDNGGHGEYTSNEPLRGAKGMLYEGGIRVPLVATLPGTIEASSVSDTPVIGMDFFPTFCEVAGIPLPEGLQLDGESFASILRGEADSKERSLFWHFPGYLERYRQARGRDSERIWRTTPGSAVRNGDWKLHEYFEDGHLELYNLVNDLGETKNLAQEHPDMAQKLLRELKAWRERVNAPVPTERNPDYRG